MGDLYLSRQGQLQSRIPITAFFICIREKRKKCNLCPGDKRLSTALDSTSNLYTHLFRQHGQVKLVARDGHASASTEGQTAATPPKQAKH